MIDFNHEARHTGIQPPPARAAASFPGVVGDFRAEIEAHGLRPGEIIPDGELRRCGTADKPSGKNGWYVFHPDPPASGAFGNWRTEESGTWTATRAEELSEAERRTLQQRIERDRAAREAAQAQRQAEAAQEAFSILAAAPSCPADHPYLATKGVRPAGDIRMGTDGALLVPIQDGRGQLMSLQRIYPDGQKRFLAGGAKQGGFFPIHGAEGPLHVCEGFATGLSVHAATGATVLCAFDCGNLLRVAENARRNNPGREILVLGDDDRWTPGNPGRTKAEAAARAVGGRAVFPRFDSLDGQPTDFNDLHAREGIEAVRVQLDRRGAPGLSISDWGVERFQGPAPVREFLVEGMIPVGSSAMLAAMGDAGKGFLLLDLLLKVSAWRPVVSFNKGDLWLGQRVLRGGHAVYLTAEDDQAEIHRRLEGLDPSGEFRRRAEGRLFVVPLPNAGGPVSLVEQVKGGGPSPSPAYFDIERQVLNLKPAILALDPLASFVAADANADPAVGAVFTGLLSSLASKTGAAVICAHHMAKGDQRKPIDSPEAARHAVRGTTALVDGVRCVVALWAAKNGEAVCGALNESFQPNKVFHAAVVKSNGPATREVLTLVRNKAGLLVARDEDLRLSGGTDAGRVVFLERAITDAARAGRHFTKTGEKGIYERRDSLPGCLQGLSRNKLRLLTQDLIDDGRIARLENETLAPGEDAGAVGEE